MLLFYAVIFEKVNNEWNVNWIALFPYRLLSWIWWSRCTEQAIHRIRWSRGGGGWLWRRGGGGVLIVTRRTDWCPVDWVWHDLNQFSDCTIKILSPALKKGFHNMQIHPSQGCVSRLVSPLLPLWFVCGFFFLIENFQFIGFASEVCRAHYKALLSGKWRTLWCGGVCCTHADWAEGGTKEAVADLLARQI